MVKVQKLKSPASLHASKPRRRINDNVVCKRSLTKSSYRQNDKEHYIAEHQQTSTTVPKHHLRHIEAMMRQFTLHLRREWDKVNNEKLKSNENMKKNSYQYYMSKDFRKGILRYYLGSFRISRVKQTQISNR